jgi:MFS family permease
VLDSAPRTSLGTGFAHFDIVVQVPYKWLVAVAFVAGLFMDLMDVTIVNVALPTLGRDFGVSTDTLEWVITGYLISLAIWIRPRAGLAIGSDRSGPFRSRS